MTSSTESIESEIVTIWSVSETFREVLNDILTSDVQWAVQSRPVYSNKKVPWVVTAFESKVSISFLGKS